MKHKDKLRIARSHMTHDEIANHVPPFSSQFWLNRRKTILEKQLKGGDKNMDTNPTTEPVAETPASEVPAEPVAETPVVEESSAEAPVSETSEVAPEAEAPAETPVAETPVA